MSNMQYIIKEHNEDPRATVIEKHGDVWSFTYQDILNARAYNDKQLKELIGNIRVAQSKVDNCKEHHPQIVDLEPVVRTAAGIYQENLTYIEKANEKIAEIVEANKSMESKTKDIFEQNPDLKKQIDELAKPNEITEEQE